MRYEDLEVGMFFTRITRHGTPATTFTYRVLKKGIAQIIYRTDRNYGEYGFHEIPISTFNSLDRSFGVTGPYIISVSCITLPKSYNEKETTAAV